MVWLGGKANVTIIQKKKKTILEMTFQNKKSTSVLKVNEPIGKWLKNILPKLKPDFENPFTYKKLEDDFIKNDLGDFNKLMRSRTWAFLRENGLLGL